MGRAQGRAEGQASDRFAGVLGSRRGTPGKEEVTADHAVIAPEIQRDLGVDHVQTTDVYAVPAVTRLRTVRSRDHVDTEIATCVYTGADGEEFTLDSAACPIRLVNGPFGSPELAPGHDLYGSEGDWVGGDTPLPHIRFTTSACADINAADLADIARRYQAGDYGDGEAGFGEYTAGDEKVYVADDAVRSPEGMPPGRNPATSPGPVTVMLPRDN